MILTLKFYLWKEIFLVILSYVIVSNMRLIIFLVIVIIIYIIATHFSVVHIDALPEKQRDKIRKRREMKKVFISNRVKDSVGR